MSKFDSISFNLSLKKFRYLYLIYIPLFSLNFFSDKELGVYEALGITALTVLVCAWLTEIAFDKFIREITCITLGETALKTKHASGKEHAIEYTQVTGPFSQNLLIVKKYTFRDMQNPFNQIIITSITENVDTLLEELQYRIANAQKK